MARIKPVEASRPQQIFESVLKWFAFGMALLRMSLSILTYFNDDLSGKLTDAGKWLAVVLAVSVAGYLIFLKKKDSRQLIRVKNFCKELFRPEMVILSVFFLWFLICTVSADDRYTASFFALNDTMLFTILVDTAIIFPLAFYFKNSGKVNVIELIIHFFAAVMTVVMIWVLWNVFHLNVINLPDGGQIGMTKSVRLCINCNPNTTGAVGEVIFFLCVYMATIKKGALRWGYVFASLVHYLIMTLSNSRAVFYASTLAMMLVAAKMLFDKEGAALKKKILFAVVGAICTAGILYVSRKLVFAAFEGITHFSELLGKSLSDRDLSLSDQARLNIWKAAMKSVVSSPSNFLCGVTPAGVISEISKFSDGKYKMYAHNEFFEVAVSMGVPGLLMYLAWLLRVGHFSAVTYLKKKTGYLPAALAMLVLANMVESTLMYYNFFTEGAFFLIAGAVIYSSDRHLRRR